MTNVRLKRRVKKAGERPYLAFGDGGDRGARTHEAAIRTREVYLPFGLSEQAQHALGLQEAPPA